MLKVVVACGCGMGSSQMMKMRAQEVFKKLNVQVSLHHTSIDEASSSANEYDLIIVSEALVRNFKNTKAKVIGLKNIMSRLKWNRKSLNQALLNKGSYDKCSLYSHP